MEAQPEGASGVVWFPAVGVVVGLAVGVTFAVTQVVLPAMVAATLAVAIGVVITGAFHEDGLADTFDAFGGGRTPDDVHRILKDPRLGTFGVLTLVLGTVVKVGAIAPLDGWAALAVLPAAHAFSRSAAVTLLGFVPIATGGSAGWVARGVTARQISVTSVLGSAIALVLIGMWVIPSIVAAVVVVVVLARWAVGKADGLTGDVLGAAQQLVEIVVLVGASAVVTNGWGTLPWWRA